jgi:hypothetical protein
VSTIITRASELEGNEKSRTFDLIDFQIGMVLRIRFGVPAADAGLVASLMCPSVAMNVAEWPLVPKAAVKLKEEMAKTLGIPRTVIRGPGCSFADGRMHVTVHVWLVQSQLTPLKLSQLYKWPR